MAKKLQVDWLTCQCVFKNMRGPITNPNDTPGFINSRKKMCIKCVKCVTFLSATKSLVPNFLKILENIWKYVTNILCGIASNEELVIIIVKYNNH